MVTCCIFETAKDTCFRLLVIRGPVRALRTIASLLVPILPLILLPPALSWAMDVVHSERAKHSVTLLLFTLSAQLCTCKVGSMARANFELPEALPQS